MTFHARCGSVAAAFLVAAALAPIEEANALSCAAFTTDVIELELEGVSEEGKPITDTSAYHGFAVQLEGSPFGDEGFTLLATTAGNKTWREQYK